MAHTFRGSCSVHHTETASPDDFVAHMRDEHGERAMRPSVSHAAIRRMWRTPKPRPFDVEPFGVGDWIAWVDPQTETTRHGQVWSLHGNKDTRWVSDGTSYVAVHRSQLVSRPWSATA